MWSVYGETDAATWASATPYITDKTVTYKAERTGWIFTPAYYWPADGYLSFVALSPSMTNETSYDATTGFSIKTWTQGQYEAVGGTYDIIDLMYSEPTPFLSKANINPADGEESATGADKNSYKGVDITFKHALSYITFKVQTAANYAATTQFSLNSITLSDIYRKGKFVQKPGSGVSNWTISDDDKDTKGTYVAYANASGEKFGYETAEATTQTPLTASSALGKEILLLPQTLTGGPQELTIEYQISTDGGTTWINQTQSIDLSKGGVATWEMGKKYTYTLSISMTEIILDPAVTVWDETGSGALNL